MDPTPVAQEVVVGPIATNTFEQEIVSFAQQAGIDPAFALLGVNAILSGVAGTQCRDLNRDSYGVVQVDASAGTAQVTVKDDQGMPVTDTITGQPCQVSFGP